MKERKKGWSRMKSWIIALFSALVLGILGAIFWELEHEHVGLLLWLLVAVALLWCCAQVSLHLYPRARQGRTRVLRHNRPRISSWVIALFSALTLGVLGVIFWLLGFENTGQLLWFLVIVALLWCCVQISLLLQPHDQQGSASRLDNKRPIAASWARSKTFLERFFPGASLRSGMYNKGSREAWDENESLPPH